MFGSVLDMIDNKQKKLKPKSSFSSVAKSCLTFCDFRNFCSPGFPVLHYLPKFAHTHVHWITDVIQQSHPLSHPHFLLPSIFPSIGVFSDKAALHIRWSKYWSFSSSISPSNEYSGLISFRIDWFDLLAVQGMLDSHLQHHNLKHQFFAAQTSLWPKSHVCTWLLEKLYLWPDGPLLA